MSREKGRLGALYPDVLFRGSAEPKQAIQEALGREDCKNSQNKVIKLILDILPLPNARVFQGLVDWKTLIL